MSYENDLIFGKNKTSHIVSVEPFEDKLVIFREVDGKLIDEVIDNKYWLITDERVSKKQRELEGDQHFKYIAELDTLEEQRKVRGLVKQNKIEHWDIFSPKEASMVYHGLTYFKDLNPKDVSVLFWDIETTGLTHDDSSKVLLISNTFRKNGVITKKLFAYDDYKNQKDLIKSWCDWVRLMDPSIFCGHNILGFDIPYMRFVAKKNKAYLNLGRNESNINIEPYVSKYRVDGNMDIEYHNAYIFGREIVDTMFLARKYDFGKKYISYGLKSIIEQEGLVKADREFYDAGQIRNNYKIEFEWAKIKRYAIDDADDAMSLFDLMAPSYFYFTQSVSKPFQAMINSATGSQINNMMVRAYLQKGLSVSKTSEASGFEGAISYGVPGIYKNCFKVDVASLYPSIMRQFKIYDPNKDTKGFFLEMVEYFTIERLKNKKLAKETGLQYYKDLEQAQKLAINSMYGFLGAPGLNYNSPDNAALVTRYGREILEKSILWSTGKEYTQWVGSDEQ